MATALKAHFDGEKITLDEPFDLPIGIPLIVTVPSLQEERDEWDAFALNALARAYSDDEPQYTLDDCKSK